jgi:hypothetical protein
MHQTITSVNDDSEHDPHAHDPHALEDTQNKHEDERWDQLHKDYNDSHDNEDNAEINTPGMLPFWIYPQLSIREGTSWMT